MELTVYLAGEIHSSWRDEVKSLAKEKNLPLTFVSPQTEHDLSDDIAGFKISDEIDDHNVQKIRGKVDYEIERYMPKRIVFDFDSVSFMDSAGIGLMIGRYKFATMLGAKVEMINVQGNVKRIFEMSGILRLIPLVEDIKLHLYR